MYVIEWMKNMKTICHAFSTTKENHYVYDLSSNKIIRVSKEISDGLTGQSNYDLSKNEDMKTLQQRGFFAEIPDYETKHPLSDSLEELLDNNLRMLTLQVTQCCNLRCGYCVYGGNYARRTHSNLRMSEATALKAIDFFIEHSGNSPALHLAFYGGEPLIEFPLIKACVNYIRQKAPSKRLTFGMTTNATLFDVEILEFCIENEFSLTFSIDGPEQIHDINRRYINGDGSFDDVIRVLTLIDSHPQKDKLSLSISAVSNPEYGYAEYNKFFNEHPIMKDKFIIFSTISSIGAKEEKIASQEYILEQEYSKALYFLHKLGKMPAADVSTLGSAMFRRLEDLHRNLRAGHEIGRTNQHAGPCIPGRQRLFVSVHGDFVPCEKVNEDSPAMIIGNLESGFNYDSIKKVLNIGELTEKECKKCWAFRFCNNCVIYADDGDGELSRKSLLKECDRIRLSAHTAMVEYCALREMGYDFNREEMAQINGNYI